MPSLEESKGSSSRRLSTQTVSDPIVLSLIEWGTSEAFEDKLSEWMQEHCSPFGNAIKMGDEQPLEWGNLYNDYCDWLDKAMEAFCEEEGKSPDEVSKRMAACLIDNKEEDFFPAFMSITEYDVFCQQMHERAIEKDREEAAKDARADGHEGNVSGCWLADASMYDPDAAEAALKHIACPWVFRKVLKRASKFIKNINIRQTDSDIEFAYSIHLFGTTIIKLEYGSEKNVVENLWKKKVVVSMDKPSAQGAITALQFENPGIPKDSVHKNKWWMEEDGEKLFWEQSIYRPDLDKEVSYLQHFVRAGKFK